jgi:hypothetical protein
MRFSTGTWGIGFIVLELSVYENIKMFHKLAIYAQTKVFFLTAFSSSELLERFLNFISQAESKNKNHSFTFTKFANILKNIYFCIYLELV